MEITGEKFGSCLHAKISGELDHHAAQKARKELDGLLSEDVRELELDLSGLTFMDSSGIGVILGRYKAVAERGGTVRVVGVSEPVDKLLRMSGLYNVIRKG